MQVYRRFSELKQFHLKATDGEVGKPDEIYFDDEDWKVRYLVVHTGGWLFGREVLIPPDRIRGIDEAKKNLTVDLSLEEIRHSPPVESEKPVSRHYEEQYYLYYGWQPYWSSTPLTLPGVKSMGQPGAFENPEKDEPEDNHLRSSEAVKGYTIHSVNGTVGHVRDFIVGDEEWAVRYLEVDTGNWLPGKKILIAPSWIKGVDWAGMEVTVQLTREAIKNAPEYDHNRLIDREYELQLFKHYSKDPGTS